MCLLQRLKNRFSWEYRKYCLKDPCVLDYARWYKDAGSETRRIDYDLDETSIVFDMGAYKGQFSADIYDKFKCEVYCFEPILEFYEDVKKRFTGNDKIHVFNYGFSDQDRFVKMNIHADGSNAIASSGENVEEVQFKDVSKQIDELNVQCIDLMEVNIEGGEYKVLPSLIQSGKIKNIKNLQIQFHECLPDAKERRDAIRTELSKTHELIYDYYFVWESWRRKKVN